MKINKDSLKARANNLSKELNISQNVIYNRFFFDAFLSRLALSKYKDKLVLKGGLYLSSLFGINNRSTMDIDFYAKQVALEKDNLISIIGEICAINSGDGVSFKIMGIEEIRDEDEYGGYQIKVQAHLENVRHEFGIDVATGDPITPSEESCDYKCLVSGETLSLKTYNLETVISEKLQTILSRGILNSRSKDYYDLYIINKTQIDKVDVLILKNAYNKTASYRHFSITKNDALNLLDAIKENEQINARWNTYCKKNNYVGDVDFASIIECIKMWVDLVF